MLHYLRWGGAPGSDRRLSERLSAAHTSEVGPLGFSHPVSRHQALAQRWASRVGARGAGASPRSPTLLLSGPGKLADGRTTRLRGGPVTRDEFPPFPLAWLVEPGGGQAEQKRKNDH